MGSYLYTWMDFHTDVHGRRRRTMEDTELASSNRGDRRSGGQSANARRSGCGGWDRLRAPVGRYLS